MTSTQSRSDELRVEHGEHPNAATMRKGFEAFGRGDLEAVRQTMAEGCTWTNSGDSPISGTFTGWDEISAMFLELFELTGGTHRNTVISIAADDTHAFAVYDSTSTIDGRTGTFRFVLANEVGADGRATACHNLPYDQDAAAAHWNG